MSDRSKPFRIEKWAKDHWVDVTPANAPSSTAKAQQQIRALGDAGKYRVIQIKAAFEVKVETRTQTTFKDLLDAEPGSQDETPVLAGAGSARTGGQEDGAGGGEDEIPF